MQHPNWPKVNYILNHKQGNGIDVQVAIWHFIGGPVPPWDPVYGTPSPAALAMIADANANGATFVPTSDQISAVIVDLGPDVQRNIIEFRCPITSELCVGGTGAFCATVTGPGPFTFSWYKDGILLPSQTNGCLTFTNAMPSDAGNYCIQVTSPCGSATTCLDIAVVNCFGITIPSVNALRNLGGGAFELELNGEIGRRYAIQASDDLVNWRTIGSATNTTGVLRFTDPHANSRCFYKVFMLP
jgi:hypothetical protein